MWGTCLIRLCVFSDWDIGLYTYEIGTGMYRYFLLTTNVIGGSTNYADWREGAPVRKYKTK